MNLFDKAKTAAPTKKSAKDELVVNRPDLENSLKKMAEINEKLAELESLKSELDSEIREAGREEMLNLYNSTKKFPGTIKVAANSMGYQFITSDRYKKIDEDRFNELAENYGSELVESATTYSFNTEVLERNMEHISQLLMGSKKLSDQDKENLIVAATAFSVKKGAIKELFNFTKESNVDGIVEDIQPVFSVKAVKEL